METEKNADLTTSTYKKETNKRTVESPYEILSGIYLLHSYTRLQYVPTVFINHSFLLNYWWHVKFVILIYNDLIIRTDRYGCRA